MLDIKYIRENMETVTEKLSRRGDRSSEDLPRLLEMDFVRRGALQESESLKNKKKKIYEKKFKKLKFLKNHLKRK